MHDTPTRPFWSNWPVGGPGVAILPVSIVAVMGNGLHVMWIDNPRFRGRIELAWRRNGPLSPATLALIALARERLVRVAHDAALLEAPDNWELEAVPSRSLPARSRECRSRDTSQDRPGRYGAIFV